MEKTEQKEVRMRIEKLLVKWRRSSEMEISGYRPTRRRGHTFHSGSTSGYIPQG
jgi:hypothetical protein